MAIIFTITILSSLILAFKFARSARNFFKDFTLALEEFRDGTGRLDVVQANEENYYKHLTFALFFLALAFFLLIIILNPTSV